VNLGWLQSRRPGGGNRITELRQAKLRFLPPDRGLRRSHAGSPADGEASQGERENTMRRADLIALAQSTGFPRVSIYLPTHLSYPENEQDPIRLSTLLKEADQKLAAAGVRRPEIDELLEEARGRVPAKMFWRYQDHGLAILIVKGKTHWVKLPRSVPELVVLSPRYHLRPMIPMFRNGENLNLLAVSR